MSKRFWASAIILGVTIYLALMLLVFLVWRVS